MNFGETLTERCGLIAGIVLCTFLIWARMGAVSKVADYCGIQDEEYIYRVLPASVHERHKKK